VKSHFQTIMITISLVAGSLLVTVPATYADEIKVPETAADHMALAKQYTEKAAAYRAEAESHRKMSEAYKKSVATSPKTPSNPWAVKMEKHCMAFVKDAEKLAADAQKAADYHTLRAKELEGK
jgi:ABC-type sugar transport system substrate-binding protein